MAMATGVTATMVKVGWSTTTVTLATVTTEAVPMVTFARVTRRGP